MFGNSPMGFGFGHIVAAVFYGAFVLFALAVVVGLLILLVRFLLVATTAAQIYVAKNKPVAVHPVPPVETTPAAHPAPTPHTPAAPSAVEPNTTPAPSTAPTSTAPTSTAPTSTAPTSTAPKSTAKPVTKPRTPRTPPAPPASPAE